MPDWRTYCRGSDGISVDGDVIEVVTSDARRHRLSVRETTDTFELAGLVSHAGEIADLENVPLRVWRHNRAAQLIGFRLDQKGRLVGEAWIPKAGLRRDEFLSYVKHIASECDLFEFHLTGKDRE